jgi:protein HOOK3
LSLFQLILGCAVNCDHKQEYIESIMGMDASSQQLIMQAIQEILNLPVRTPAPEGIF